MRIDDVRSIGLDPAGVQPGWLDSLPFPNPAAGAALLRTVPSDMSERLRSVKYTFTPSAVAATRQPVFNVLDGQGNIVDQYLAGPPVPASFPITSFLSRRAVPDALQAQSNDAEGSVNGPLAGGVIASTGNLPQGEYSVTVVVRLGGTTAATDGNNMQLQVGATVVEVINQGSASGSVGNLGPVNVDAPGGQPITVNAIAAGTGTATYTAQIVATLIAGTAFYGSLPDILIPAGWSWQIAVNAMDAGDTITNVRAAMWRYPATALLPSPGG